MDITCSDKRTAFQECSVRKTVNLKEQIMSNNKFFMCTYTGMFVPNVISNGGYCVYYPSNIFRNTNSFETWGIFQYSLFHWGLFVHMLPLCLD